MSKGLLLKLTQFVQLSLCILNSADGKYRIGLAKQKPHLSKYNLKCNSGAPLGDFKPALELIAPQMKRRHCHFPNVSLLVIRKQETIRRVGLAYTFENVIANWR